MENKDLINTQLSDRLREQLHLLFPDSKDASAKREVTINCPLCNREGMTDTGHHMYISLGLDGKPPMFNCFRNINHRGILTKEVLEEFTGRGDIIDSELLSEIETNNKRVSNLSRYRLNRHGKLDLQVPIPQDNQISAYKLGYLNNRLGLNLTYEDLASCKIILSLYEFLNHNKFNKVTRSKQIADTINNVFIGFLNNNNSAIIFRNLMNDEARKKVHKSLDSRYIKYTISDGEGSGYYIIPSVCNVYEHIDIHIAEGTFDILSVFYNLRGANRNNNIFAAIGGNTYLSLIKYFITTQSLIDVTFHIYIDNDIEDYVLKGVKAKMTPLGIPVYVHVNMYEGEKDFGVSKDKISEYVYKLC